MKLRSSNLVLPLSLLYTLNTIPRLCKYFLRSLGWEYIFLICLALHYCFFSNLHHSIIVFFGHNESVPILIIFVNLSRLHPSGSLRSPTHTHPFDCKYPVQSIYKRIENKTALFFFNERICCFFLVCDEYSVDFMHFFFVCLLGVVVNTHTRACYFWPNGVKNFERNRETR